MGGFEIADAVFTNTGNAMTLDFTRPLIGHNQNITTSGNRVLFAAGSKKVSPPTDTNCNSVLTFKNHHDLGGLGFVQSPPQKFMLLADHTLEDSKLEVV